MGRAILALRHPLCRRRRRSTKPKANGKQPEARVDKIDRSAGKQCLQARLLLRASHDYRRRITRKQSDHRGQ